jgi:hypothetical protein
MATFQAVFVPTSPIANVSTFTGTLGAAGNATIVLAPRTLFAIAVQAQCNIKFGNASKVPAAAATDWPIFATTIQEWDTGEEFDRFNLFSTAGSVYWVYCISQK